MKGVIVYKGKYGATRQYAEWLNAELQLPLMDPQDLSATKLAMYDFLVIGSSVYEGRLLTRSWLKQHAVILQNKKVFLFIVCATPPTKNEKLQVIAKNNIPEIMLKNSSVYFLHGRMILEKLSWMDRFMLKMGARLEKDPVAKKAMLQDFDAVKKDNIAALVNSVKAYSQAKKDTMQHYLHTLKS